MIRTSPLAALLLVTPLLAAAAQAQARLPNIVLIMADDVGVEAFGCYGGTSYETPNIDRLAATGMRFTQCHAQPLCTPTRVKLLTGLTNARNYRAFSVLPPDATTFAQVLKTANYRTGVFGKWQLWAAEHYPADIRGTGTRPRDAGFDRWCLWQVDKLGSRYWKPQFELHGAVQEGGADEYGPDRYTDQLLRFVQESVDAQQPFLAYYPMALVHSPFEPTPDSPERTARRGPQHFAAMMGYMDKLVGRIHARLGELGVLENTLFLFTADNGTNRQIRSKVGERTVRGGKGTTTDAGTHVPLIASWPKTIRPGSVCDDLVDFSDFFPTFVELARLRTELQLDGRSFLPQLRGEEGRPREAIYCWYHPRPWTRKRSQPVRFARDARFKLYGDGRLFDLGADPEETRALAEEVAVDARQRLQAVLERMPTRPVEGFRLRGRVIDAVTRRPVSRQTFDLHFFCDDLKARKSLPPVPGAHFAVDLPAGRIRVRAFDSSRTYALFEGTVDIGPGEKLLDILVQPTNNVTLRGKLLMRATGKPVPVRMVRPGPARVGGTVLLTFHHAGRPCHTGHISPAADGSFELKVPRGLIDVAVVNTSMKLEATQLDLRDVEGAEVERGLWLR